MEKQEIELQVEGFIGYYGVLKCPSCGTYSHFMVAPEKMDLIQFQRKGLLVCKSCFMAFYPMEEELRNSFLEDRGWIKRYRLADLLWNFYRERARAFMDRVSVEEFSDREEGLSSFLQALRVEGEGLWGFTGGVEPVFSGFFSWFCEEYAIPSTEDRGCRGLFDS